MDNLQKEKVDTTTYEVGSVALEDGFYICVPCGDKKYLKTGQHFKSCLKCFGKDWRLFKRGLELWEKIKNI